MLTSRLYIRLCVLSARSASQTCSGLTASVLRLHGHAFYSLLQSTHVDVAAYVAGNTDGSGWIPRQAHERFCGGANVYRGPHMCPCSRRHYHSHRNVLHLCCEPAVVPQKPVFGSLRCQMTHYLGRPVNDKKLPPLLWTSMELRGPIPLGCDP